jgi:hypothetical protein
MQVYYIHIIVYITVTDINFQVLIIELYRLSNYNIWFKSSVEIYNIIKYTNIVLAYIINPIIYRDKMF